jgi:exosortase/archaeosortase family protein
MKKSVERNKGNPFLIVLRYLILLSLMFSLPIIYKIFSILTIYPVVFLLRLIYPSVLLFGGEIITINMSVYIQIIPACIAGSAYLLLLILNLSVPMNAKKRIFSLVISVLLLLCLNILRIFGLSVLYYNKNNFFDFTHLFFWYVLSTLFVIVIWFLTVKLFSIKEIPVYSDLDKLYKASKKRG